MACLAHVFEEEDALDKLEAFTSLNGPAFYKLPPNEGRMTLRRNGTPFPPPDKVMTSEGLLTVFDPGFEVYWYVSES